MLLRRVPATVAAVPRRARTVTVQASHVALMRPPLSARRKLLSASASTSTATRLLSSTLQSPEPQRVYTKEEVVQWLRAERAEQVTALDVSHLLGGSVGETFVFATGRSQAHMLRVGKAVRQEFTQRGVLIQGKPPTIEGKGADEGGVRGPASGLSGA